VYHAANNYDSSGDYWRVNLDEKGRVIQVRDDGDRENATIVDVNGTEFIVKLRSGSVSEAIAAAVGNGMTKEQINTIMVNSGLDWTQDKGWYANEERARYIAPIVLLNQQSSLNTMQSWAISKVELVIDWLSIRGADITSFFGWRKDQSQDKETIQNYFEITSKNGETITLYSIGSDNQVLSQLVKQNDPAFSDIPDLVSSGCNFRVVQAYCELLAGKALTAEQVKKIWRETADTAIMRSDGWVKNADLLADKTLALLGRTDIGLTFGNDWRKNGTLIGYPIGMPYRSGSHYTLGDLYKNLVYNPGNTNVAANDWRSVYVYSKK